MIKNEYILKVDLKKKHTAVTPTFVQYDEAVLRFLISDNGKPFFFSGQTSIKTYHKRKDGVVVEGEARVEVVKGIQQIVYEYSGNEMYQLGYVDTSLVIYSGDKKVSIQPFKVLIVDSIYDDVATPANPEYGALQHLIVSVEDLIKKVNVKITEADEVILNANEAIDNANSAAENVQTTISEWKYADTYTHTTSYKKNNVVSYNGSTFIAIRDTLGNYPIGNLSDENWRIMALKGQDGVVVLNKEDFKATLNQTDFTLPLEYDQHQGRVRVIVDGVEQFTPDNFVELSSTKIRMNSGLRQDADVKIIYFGNAPALKNDIQLQIDNINDLLEHFNLAEANTAIAHATTQGDYAKTKGDAANTATTQANTARDSANSAATSANTAATNANTAKDAAITATNKANTATALVESATSNANTATTNAITAANDANTAKNNANQAAVSANDAVANMSPKGAYSSTTNYLPRNIVSYLGSSYMNIVASKGILPTVTANWQPVGSKGDKGDTGFGFTWKQEYNPNFSYIRDDVVYYNGSSYIALKSVTGITPSNDNINWNIITQRGLDGMGSVSSVNGVNPDLEGNVTISTVTSVNGQTGVIAGLETVADSNSKLSNKVDKVTGKGLSTNDFTTAEKTKLNGIETGAQVNTITSVNGATGVITGLATDISVDNKLDGKSNVDHKHAINDIYDLQTSLTTLNEKAPNFHNHPIADVNGLQTELNKIGILTDLKTTNKANLVGAVNEVKTNLSDTFQLSPSIVQFPVHESWRAAQGVTTDGRFIYTFTDRTNSFSLENIITVYTMDGKFASEKRLAYTGLDTQGKFMSFGDANIIDGFIYATVYNINGGGNPLMSRVVKFNKDDLSIDQVYEIGGQTAESVTKHNNHFWTVYHDVNVVRKFDLNFNFVQEYPLTVDSTPHGGFQGSLWEGDYFYANLHGHNWNSDPNPFAELRKYHYDGTSFTFIESIKPPTNGCSQGLTEYNGYYFWNDRPNHSIVISKSLNRGKIVPETQPYNHSDSFKPDLLSGWEVYDLVYDRTARVTKTNDGVILLSGIIKATPSVIYGNPLNPIFTIPKIYTPKYSVNFMALSDKGIIRLGIIGKNSTSGIDEIGKVIPYNIQNYVDIQWLSLDGINYPILE